METFTAQPASVYFTIIQAIKVVPHKFPIPGELWDAPGPRSSPRAAKVGSLQPAQLLAWSHPAGRHHCSPAQPAPRKSESQNPWDCFNWLKFGVSGFLSGDFPLSLPPRPGYFFLSFEAQECFGYWQNVLKTLGPESKQRNSLRDLLGFKVQILKNGFHTKLFLAHILL